MKVLLVGVGEFYHTGAFFQRALKDLGHRCFFLDEQKYVGNRLGELIAYRLWDKKPLRYREFNRELVSVVAKFQPDIVLATKGSFISPEALIEMKRCSGAVLVNYATDDPFNRRTSGRHIVDAIPHYDVYICTKRAIMEDVRRAGCPTVVFVPFGYEPSIYYPEQPLTDEEQARFRSDVAFIGGADADRYPFFEALLDAIPDLDLHLYGGYWGRHSRLKKYHRGFATGRDYCLVIGGTKIAPCLVRRANRDGHVMRTFEVPACGGFMLHERTPELREFFDEGIEVACFGSAEELVAKVQYYLAHADEREAVARAGHVRCVPAYSYDNRVKEILSYHCNGISTQLGAVAVGG
ncbi:MAG TPA: glycosyltransferase [Terriglobales bacterium]|nr:glycosyltransferase [Terriglobales bacterium]